MDPAKEEEEKKEEANVTDNQKVSEEVSRPNQEEDEETPEKINWKKFREKRAKEKREADQARVEKEKAKQQAELLKEALKHQINKDSKEEDNNSAWNPDEDYIKKSDLDAILRERIEKEREQQEAASLPSRLKSHMPDFDQVCTDENTAYLEYHHPEIAEEISDIRDPFKKWRSLHRAIKTNVPNYTQLPEVNRQKIEKNLSKPQSSASVSDLGKSETITQITDAQKRQNWKKIMEITGGNF